MRPQGDVYQWLVKRSLSLCLLAIVCPAMANPSGGQVVAGSASIRYGSTTVITQHTNKAIVNWNSFSIGPNETTRIIMPTAQSVILNRVTGNNTSEIMGSLTSNGQVFLVNPSGIVFGKTAHVDVAALIASTANITNSNFMNGNYQFANAPISSQIINNGTITIKDAGLAALVAPSVQNNGVIQARLGRVALGAGTAFTIDLYGDNLITFDASSTASVNEINNLGRIEANGGTVMLTAATANALVENVINMSGYISARSVSQHEGKIILQGYGNTNVNVTGTLNVSAGQTGNAGTIRVLSGGTTQVSGNLLATGGALSGNGGVIETSGANLITNGIYVNAGAAHGTAGSWLLDPTNITVSDATALSYSSILATTNLTISATNDIDFDNTVDPVNWTSNTNFTVDAGHNINFNTGASTAINTTGTGTITLYSDFNNTGSGTVTFTGVPPATNTVNAPSTGVNLYYNPTSYPTADTFNNINSGLVAYMLVHNATELQEINSNLGGNYALGGNISAGAFTPIGNATTPFEGLFNGNGFTISNLNINLPSTNEVGLFGLAVNAIIENLTLSNATITGGNNVGLVGYTNQGQIQNVSVLNSTFTGQDSVGSIVGYTYGIASDPAIGTTINNVFSNSNVNGTTNVGGLIGSLTTGGKLSNGLYNGTVTGTSNVGGLVGSTAHTNITNSLAIATLIGNSNVGGAVGSYGFGTLTGVYSSTTTFSGPAVGNGSVSGATALPGMSLTTLPSGFNSDGNFWQTNGSNNYISLVSCGASCIIPVTGAGVGLGKLAAQYVTVEQILNNNILTTTPTLVYYSDDSLMYTVPLSTGGGIYVVTITEETPAQTEDAIESAIGTLQSAYGCPTSL